MHGGGFTGSGEDNMGTTVRVDFREGRFRVLASSVEMGQGSATILPMIVAEALGVRMEDITAPPADTDRVPNSGPTVASRTTTVRYLVRRGRHQLSDPGLPVHQRAHGDLQRGVQLQHDCL